MKMDAEKLRQWLAAMQEFGVSELRYEEEDVELHLKRESSSVVSTPVYAAPVQPLAQEPVAENTEAEAEPAVEDSGKVVPSPVVGVFYAAASPDSPPFVTVGDEVEEGDVLCIIEAMKLMNEVLAPHSGKVREVLCQSGQKVEYGQALLILE